MISGWRHPSFARLIAWSESGVEKTYLDLNNDLDQVLEKFSVQDLLVIEDQGPYQNLLLYLWAWEKKKCLCLLPKSWPAKWKEEVSSRMESHMRFISKDCFYILPTSGSTGTPKLVAVSRENWQALMQGLEKIYSWPIGTRVALAFEGVFDPFIALIFMSLSQGAVLCPLPAEQRFDIFSFLQKNEIEIWASVPSLALLNWPRKQVSELAKITETIFTGESLSPELVKLWQGLAPHSRIDNLYGPVEATVWTLRKSYLANEFLKSRVALGNVLSPKVQIEISDSNELILKGEQVALGYIESHGLQAFAGHYATGDLVEVQDSEIYYLGRKDQQLKILGHRIELEAIEAVFLRKTGKACICGVDLNQNIYLVAQDPVDSESVRKALQEDLPPSHWPRFYFHCDQWPRTASGKVDRNAIENMVKAGQLNGANEKKESHGNS